MVVTYYASLEGCYASMATATVAVDWASCSALMTSISCASPRPPLFSLSDSMRNRPSRGASSLRRPA